MSREERQKITSDKFRDNFDEIFSGASVISNPEHKAAQRRKNEAARKMLDNAHISKKNTKLDQP